MSDFKLKVHFESRPEHYRARMFVYDSQNDYYLDANNVVKSREFSIANTEKPIPFMEGSESELMAIAEAFATFVRTRGGIDTEQRNAGIVETQAGEITWLRGLVERQMK